MTTEHIESGRDKQAGFVRLGGLTIFLGLLIHIIANMVLKTFPSEDFTPAELLAYLSAEKGTWAVVHGMRYVAIVCIIIFSAALFIRICLTASSAALGWGIVGLLGTTLMMANLMIANGVEILAFFDYDRLSEQGQLFWLLFYLSRVLFTAEIVAWAILILGFSMAGLFSGSIPKLLIVLGLLSATACLLSSVFVISILTEGWASSLIEWASLTGLLWFICMGAYMLIQKPGRPDKIAEGHV